MYNFLIFVIILGLVGCASKLSNVKFDLVKFIPSFGKEKEETKEKEEEEKNKSWWPWK